MRVRCNTCKGEYETKEYFHQCPPEMEYPKNKEPINKGQRKNHRDENIKHDYGERGFGFPVEIGHIYKPKVSLKMKGKGVTEI